MVELPVPRGISSGILSQRPPTWPVGPAAGAPGFGAVGPNNVIANDTAGSSITVVGPYDLDLAAALSDNSPLRGGSPVAGYPGAPTPLFFQSGVTAAGFSTTGGKTWGLAWLGLNSSWVVPSPSSCSGRSTSCGDVHGGDAVVASDGRGRAVIVDTFAQSCLVGGATTTAACNSTVNITAPAGIDASLSTSGGRVWAAPLVLASYAPYLYVRVTISGCGTAVGFILANYTIGTPAVAWSPTGHTVTATWSEITYTSPVFMCIQGTVYYADRAQAFEYSSTSSNGGLNWSAALRHGNSQSAYGTIAITRNAKSTEYLAFGDYLNASSSVPIALTISHNGGSNWSTAADIHHLKMVPVLGMPQGGYPPDTRPLQLVADTGPHSPFAGNLYLVWSDNRSASVGDPSIAFSRSTNRGVTWTAPVFLTPNSSAWKYALPSMAVASDSSVWISFYNVSARNGSYVAAAIRSADGGSTWSGEFPVSGALSISDFGPGPVGAVDGIAVSPAGAFPTWIACTPPGCSSATGRLSSAYVGEMEPVSMATNVPRGVTGEISTLGANRTLSLNTTVLLTAGASVAASVPLSEPYNTTAVYAFQHWGGLLGANSTADPYTFTFSGPGRLLSAVYAIGPSATITGHLGPNVSTLRLSLNGLPVPLTTRSSGSRTFSIQVGAFGGATYKVVVSAGAPYHTFRRTITPLAGHIYFVNVTLHLPLPAPQRVLAGLGSPAAGPQSASSAVGVPFNANGLSAVYAPRPFYSRDGRGVPLPSHVEPS